MLFHYILIALPLMATSESQNEMFDNNFCDPTLKNNTLIDKVFQTLTTIYVMRQSLVYPMDYQTVPFVGYNSTALVQKREAFSIQHLFLGITGMSGDILFD